jgi:endonuclease/exonuclease/phosphatase family metal-dependent hydrolase
MNANFFHFHLNNIVTKIPTNYPTIIIGDFNINMLTNTIESITLQNYMNTHNFHITFIQSITCNNTQIDHIWTSAPTQ